MSQFIDPKDNGKGERTAPEGTIPGHSAVVDHSKLPLWFIKSRNTIYYVLSVIEVLLAFRFVFMLLGANRRSGFIMFLYGLTGIFTAPFEGIFSEYYSSGLSTGSVFDPAAPIAMIVYAIVALGLIKLLWVKISRDGY